MDPGIITKKLDAKDLEGKVKKMYRDVALNPTADYHFEMGRNLAEKLGYEMNDLNRLPAPSIESFAGVGYFMDIANIRKGERVLDLGSGSGMDVFIASLYAGQEGHITGIDMTDEQLDKADRLAKQNNIVNVNFIEGYLEDLPFANESFDVVISNGVINLCPDKEKVFSEVSRVLRQGGRMVIADIVSENQLPENITCDSTLWASCIGGAAQEDSYRTSIESAGLEVIFVRNNSTYQF